MKLVSEQNASVKRLGRGLKGRAQGKLELEFTIDKATEKKQGLRTGTERAGGTPHSDWLLHF